MYNNPSIIILNKENVKYKTPNHILKKDPLESCDIGWVEQMLPLISTHSSPHHNILDIFAGLGSTAIAAKILHRNAYMVEINATRSKLIQDRWDLFVNKSYPTELKVFTNDCLSFLKTTNQIPPIHLCLTNIPYFSKAHKNINTNNLNLYYLKNYKDYLTYIKKCFIELRKHLVGGGSFIITCENIRDPNGEMIPLAWDIAKILKDHYTLFDEKIICYPNTQRDNLYPMHTNRQHEYILISKKYLTLQQCKNLTKLILKIRKNKIKFKIFGSFNQYIQENNYKHIGDLDLMIPFNIRNLKLLLFIIKQKYNFQIWSWNILLDFKKFSQWNFTDIFKKQYLRLIIFKKNDTIQIDLVFKNNFII